MATVIKLKRGTTTPTTSDIVSGEVAVDTSTQKLYINDSGTVKEIGGGGLADIVDDTTPQLGGNLDLNSNDITGTGNIDIAGTSTVTPSVTITTTNDGVDAGPIIDLVRDSSTPATADYLGQLKFRGDNDAGSSQVYAKITGKIGDVTSGSEDGIIEFAVKNGGSNDIPVRINQNGIYLNAGFDLKFEGTTADPYETTLKGGDPTGDRTITLPDSTGTVALTSDLTPIQDDAFINSIIFG